MDGEINFLKLKIHADWLEQENQRLQRVIQGQRLLLIYWLENYQGTIEEELVEQTKFAVK